MDCHIGVPSLYGEFTFKFLILFSNIQIIKLDPTHGKFVVVQIQCCENLLNYYEEMVKIKHNSNSEQKFK